MCYPDNMNLPTIIALVVIISAFTFVVGLIIFRRSQGSIDVNFKNEIYRLGDGIKGTVSINAKRPLALKKTTVNLECFELLDGSTNGGISHSIIYEDRAIHADLISLRVGQKFDIPFSFNFPKKHPSDNKVQAHLHIQEPEYACIGSHISAYHRVRFRWCISVNAETDSIVIYGGKAIKVEGYTLKDKHDAYKAIRKLFWK